MKTDRCGNMPMVRATTAANHPQIWKKPPKLFVEPAKLLWIAYVQFGRLVKLRMEIGRAHV